MVMAVTAIATLVLAATMGRTLTNAKMNNRSNEYNVTGTRPKQRWRRSWPEWGMTFRITGWGRSLET